MLLAVLKQSRREPFDSTLSGRNHDYDVAWRTLFTWLGPFFDELRQSMIAQTVFLLSQFQ